MIQEEIARRLKEVVKNLTHQEGEITLSRPKDSSHGDFTTNIAFKLSKELNENPGVVASDKILSKLDQKFFSLNPSSDKVYAFQKNGFINFQLPMSLLITKLQQLLVDPEKIGTTSQLKNKKIMVEYAHPNTHKEAHIGHTRTLMTGESLARIFEANGATVFRANYQGDVGPHVAKAVYGIAKTLEEEGKTLDDYENLPAFDKIHFVAMSYARGNTDYEGHKEEVNNINRMIYAKGKDNPALWEIYRRTRQWSLDYYDDMYKLFGTKFDKLFLETEVADDGPKIVRKYIGKVFVEDKDGSVIFPGEKYGLHTRVFITQQNTPTYEGKEMALGFMESERFAFDKKIHVVGSEQEGYFQVVFKALELIDPKRFVGKQYHLPTGIIQLKGRKMSSRTGDVLTYNQLIDEVKESVGKLFTNKQLPKDEMKKATEDVALGAIKYSVLKGGTRQNVVFDMEKSISLQGDSGPYIQYTYVRTQSILSKSKATGLLLSLDYTPAKEELELLRYILGFADTVAEAAKNYAPNVIAEYLYELAKSFNAFYQKYRIVDAKIQEEKDFRLILTSAVGQTLAKGLNLLGIAAPERM